MTQCWSEGALRAYLDRELSAEEIQRAAAHLRECAECSGRCEELAARAEQVGEWMDLLPEPEMETLQVSLRLPRKAIGGPRVGPRVGWVGAAVALAAGLGIAAYVIPRTQATPVVVAVTVAPPTAPAAASTEVPTERVMAAPREERAMAVRPVRNAANAARRTRRPAEDLGDFVALDDEPFESGVVMRVAVAPGKTQADIVFGPDGRARAFRLVKASGQKY